MKVIFISNYFNHHQKPFSDEMFKKCEFRFVETLEITAERQALGWKKYENLPYLVRLNDLGREGCLQLISDADVVIIGSAPEYLIRDRIKQGKLIFRYAERPLKKGFEPIKYLPRFIRWCYRNPMKKPIYMLCASAYTAKDYRKFGLFKRRTYKFGYFPEIKKYSDVNTLIANKSKTNILWCGRLIDLKHPEYAIEVARRLMLEGYEFVLNIIGCGIMEEEIQKKVVDNKLEDQVRFLGTMSPEIVRSYMEHAGIFLVTSNRREGWGAVLNESMNSGCAVIASRSVGATQFLIEDEKNGLIYDFDDVNLLFDKVKYLLDNPKEQERLGQEAYNTMINEWNAEIAADRFLKLAERILTGEKYPELYSNGPCSISY